MGYNLLLACHSCAERAFALRGEEAEMIAKFAAVHRGRQHFREVRVDNGWSRPDDFPYEYTDTYDEVKAIQR